MFLRSLTLKGFKSFAEPTTLEFEPGVTVVVGPNGSGKSNLVDAVAWVLGAQGPRSLRSGRMDDVIFAGGGGRSPLGRAEVALTIDNSSGLLPIEFTDVTITRTLFRSSGESEYAINGVPCRLLDVQELLSDSGVGRQQHVIVSQGQLDAVLDARPEDRRMVVEEAAGILKFRRRKEKAQRRLESTEANLLRLADLLREVRRQLRPLERQAEATRRHDALASQLRALRLHVAGRQLLGLRGAVDVADAAERALAGDEGRLREELAALDVSVASAERWLSAVGAVPLDEVVSRLGSLRERARGLAAVLAERRRSIERDRAAEVDAALVASLEADARALEAELAEVDAESANLGPELDELGAAQAELAAERSELEARAAARTSPGRGRAAEARGELAALRSAADRDRAEQARLENRLASLEDTLATVGADLAGRRVELENAARVRNRLGAVLAEADSERDAAAAEVAAAEAARREADAEVTVWAARTEALVLALEHARASGGRIDDVPGVLGALADLVVVETGWEAAFEVAAGGALAAMVVDGPDAARRALAEAAGGASPAVLALGLPARPDVPAAPPGADRVRDHVSGAPGGPSGVEALLDVLLRGAVAVGGGWEEALDVALAQPSAVVVTRSGDRFAPDGWRVGGGGPAAARAALADARARADRAAAAAREVAEWLDAAQRALADCAHRCDSRARALADHDRETGSVSDAFAGLEAERRDLATTVEELRSAIADQQARLASAEARVAELEAALPQLEGEEAEGVAVEAALAAEARRLRERSDALADQATEAEIKRTALGQRRDYLATRLADVESRLGRLLGADGHAALARQAALERTATCVERLAGTVEGSLADIEVRLADARLHRQRQAEVLAVTTRRLDALRRRRADAERRLEDVRERSRRAALEAAQAAMRLDAAVEAVRRELDVEPEAAETAPCPDLPPGTSPERRARELDRELRLLGPVNPLATEELADLQQRHAFLEGQLEDVRTTRRELGRVIRAVDAEIVQLLSAAYADVADNFGRLFETLFPGGQGRLRLTDADDLLETGIEIEARPAGKNVRRLSLLSGGERSLCALAFLFAVFRSRPSPFYLLDEVEAALDDVNLHRFLDLLAEFRQEAQLVVVSHQKRTMEAADCLYGVTMQAGGTSRVVSERVGATTSSG